tara:strand:+ start:2253 stop:2624 length:372 start_codon:yes stop_codon:yes gene_type:complete
LTFAALSRSTLLEQLLATLTDGFSTLLHLVKVKHATVTASLIQSLPTRHSYGVRFGAPKRSVLHEFSGALVDALFAVASTNEVRLVLFSCRKTGKAWVVHVLRAAACDLLRTHLCLKGCDVLR